MLDIDHVLECCTLLSQAVEDTAEILNGVGFVSADQHLDTDLMSLIRVLRAHRHGHLCAGKDALVAFFYLDGDHLRTVTISARIED